MPNIGYNIRARATGEKLSGGSFGGTFGLDTVQRLVSSQLTVKVNNGQCFFIDRNGAPCRLYIHVDAESTEAGKEALKQWRITKALQDEEDRRKEQAEKEELETLMNSMSHEDIIKALKGARNA